MSVIPCPSCGASVDAPAGTPSFACPYCGSLVQPASSADDGAPSMDEVRRLVASRNMIAAIKVYRELTGVGLAEAKAAVEAMDNGPSQSAPTVLHMPPPVESASPFNSSAELMDKVKELLRSGNKIEAIRIYREYFNVGLKDAKDAVDQVETELKYSSAPTIIASAPIAPSAQETVISANPFDEPKKPSNTRKWVIGCSVAAILFLCLCVILPFALSMLGVFQAFQ